jgi:hypothetical protein
MRIPSRPNSNPRNLVLFAWLGAILLGAFIRLYPAATSDFPINDGGLFYRFILELQDHQYDLPLTSMYNQAQVPYVYPPLSFYLAGLINTLLPISLLDVMRWLPAIISVLTIPAFYWLARDILETEFQALLAVYCFTLLPTAFDFMVVGGGLSRSFGTLFSILTLQQEIRMLRGSNWKNTLGTGIFAALTVLSHPVAAWFTLFSAAAILLFEGRNKAGITRAATVVLVGIAFSAPWWGTMLLHFGPKVLISAFQAGQLNTSNFFALFLFIHTNEPLLNFQAMLGLLGVFACLHQKNFFIPFWLLIVFLLEPRLSATYAVMPTTLLAAIGLDVVVLAGLSGKPVNQNSGVPRLNNAGRLLVLYLLVYGLVSAFVAAPHTHLSQAERRVMSWIQNNLPSDQSFLVVSGIASAGSDYVSEWLPALTNQISLGTPQGSEWLPGDMFRQLWTAHETLQMCFNRDGVCLDKWAAQIHRSYDYVLVTPDETGESGALPDFLNTNKNFQMLYQDEGVVIYRHNPYTAQTR